MENIQGPGLSASVPSPSHANESGPAPAPGCASSETVVPHDAGGSRSRQPTIDAIQRDITLANNYRIELIKYLLAIAAALFAFTVTFRPSLERVDVAWAMWLGWFGLGVSMIGGMFHMLGWDHFYKSYRDYDWKSAGSGSGKSEGKAARDKINKWRRLAMFFQFGGFILGVASIGLFAGANIDNVRKPESTRQQQTAPAAQSSQPSKNSTPR